MTYYYGYEMNMNIPKTNWKKSERYFFTKRKNVHLYENYSKLNPTIKNKSIPLIFLHINFHYIKNK